MPVKYVDEKTGELIPKVVKEQTGAPSAYGIKTIKDLVRTSMLSPEQLADHETNIFFNKRAAKL